MKTLEVLSEETYFELLGSTKQSWDDYYMRLCYMIATKSKDTSSKCGCVIVDQNYQPISIGYNGAIANIDDSQVPQNRPDKYFWAIHAEENAILFAKHSLKDSIVYVNGHPCSKCIRMMAQKGVGKIVYGDVKPKCVDEEDRKHGIKMLELSGTPLIHHSVF